MASIESRLKEWALWRLEPGLSCFPQATVQHRIMVEQENAGARADGVQMQVIGEDETGPEAICPPDGGVGAMVDRMAGAIVRDRRCAEIQKAFIQMPDAYQLIVRSLYFCEHPRDIPRSWKAAAQMIELKEHEFRAVRERMIGWLEGNLCIATSRRTVLPQPVARVV